MALFDSELSVFQITDTGASLRDLSAFINEVRGLPGPRGLNQVTALGDGGAKHFPTIEDVTINLSGWWDNTATTGPDVVLSALRTHGSATAFDYGPEGKTSGDFKYSGACWVENYEIVSRVGNTVEWTAVLRVDGVVTRGTY